MTVAIDAGTNTTITSSKKYIYTAKIKDPCGAEDRIIFTWALIKTSNPIDLVNITAKILPPKVQNQLSISENTLLPGYYYDFQVTATSGPLLGSATIRLITESSPLIVKIDKANGSVSGELDLVIDGSSSYDPNKLAKTIYFIWSCSFEDTGKICEDSNGSSLIQVWDQSILTIPSTSLVGGKSHKFTLTISNDYDKRTSSTNVILKVIAGLSTNININPPEGLVQPSYSLEVMATITSKTTYSLKWTMLEGPEGIKIEHDNLQVIPSLKGILIDSNLQLLKLAHKIKLQQKLSSKQIQKQFAIAHLQ
jgi:hypothetical protein